MTVCLRSKVACVMLSILVFPMNVDAQSTSSGEMSAEEIEHSFEEQKTRGLKLETTDRPVVAGAYVGIFSTEAGNFKFQFISGSGVFNHANSDQLQVVCEDIEQSGSPNFQVVGFVNQAVELEAKSDLAQQRAEVLKKLLVDTCGVDESMLVAVARN